MSRYLFSILVILLSITFAAYIAGGIVDSLAGIAQILGTHTK